MKKAYWRRDGLYTHTNTKGTKVWNNLFLGHVRKFIENEKTGVGNDRDKTFAKKEKVVKKISKWDSKKKKLYFNTGKIVKGIAVFKGKFYAINSKGVYSAKKTKKIRAAAVTNKPWKPLKKLLGKPKKTVYADSCLEGGKDGVITYTHFEVYTFKDSKGKETVQGYDSRYDE